jgi:hypothetical protein
VSTESLRNRVSQLQKERALLQTSLAREQDYARKKQAEINRVSRSNTKNTSLSILRSKQRQIETKEKQLSGYQKKVADLTKKVASKDAEILRKVNELEKAEARARRTKDQEENRRRDSSLKHTRDVTRELERQSRLHSRMSNSPIIVKFEDLPQQITVLFVASNPSDQTQLKLDEEIREIQEKIRASDFRESINLKSVWAARPTDLLQAINEHKPTIVHFSGHGSDQDELVLQDDIGDSQVVSKETLVELFKVVSSGIELVVFNTCFSDNQANDVTAHVSASIGMGTSIGDEAARVFAAQFYSAIGFGKSVGEAFGQAKVALMLQNIPEEDTPKLYVSQELNENEIVLVQPS